MLLGPHKNARRRRGRRNNDILPQNNRQRLLVIVSEFGQMGSGSFALCNIWPRRDRPVLHKAKTLCLLGVIRRADLQLPKRIACHRHKARAPAFVQLRFGAVRRRTVCEPPFYCRRLSGIRLRLGGGGNAYTLISIRRITSL